MPRPHSGQRLAKRRHAALFDRGARAGVDDVAGVRQIHVLLAEVEAHGARPGIVGSFLGTIYRQVLIPDGAADLAAEWPAYSQSVPLAARRRRRACRRDGCRRVPPRPVAAAVVAAVDASVVGPAVLVVADQPNFPLPTLGLHAARANIAAAKSKAVDFIGGLSCFSRHTRPGCYTNRPAPQPLLPAIHRRPSPRLLPLPVFASMRDMASP